MLAHYRFEPTILETAPRLRTGGYVIDFWGAGFEIADRMDLLPGDPQQWVHAACGERCKPGRKNVAGLTLWTSLGCPTRCSLGEYLKTWIDRLALNREHTGSASVGAAEWLFTNEPFQRFDSESELTRSGRGLGAESGRTRAASRRFCGSRYSGP